MRSKPWPASTYGEAGFERLRSIRELVAPGQGNPATLLHRRLLELKEQIDGLRAQQRLLAGGGMVTKELWVGLLAAAAFTQQDMASWHRAFEADSPEAHTRFLESVGIPRDEIDFIKAWSGQRAATATKAARRPRLGAVVK